ncbi:hypothetical protein GOODEAATRI_024176 [Goodea atripinnis]|uniref:Uncharacterized protein n=1 Tax=Goodea atripinnis TaxID=208336 RepID=A0ABV0Q0K4_9TELE
MHLTWTCVMIPGYKSSSYMRIHHFPISSELSHLMHSSFLDSPHWLTGTEVSIFWPKLKHLALKDLQSNCFRVVQMQLTSRNISSPSIHPSIVFRLSRVGSRGQQAKQRDPDFPLPSHLGQLVWGNPKAFPGHSEKHSPSSVSWVFLWASSRWDVPRTPHQGGVHEASYPDARATSTGSSRRGEAVAPL